MGPQGRYLQVAHACAARTALSNIEDFRVSLEQEILYTHMERIFERGKEVGLVSGVSLHEGFK